MNNRFRYFIGIVMLLSSCINNDEQKLYNINDFTSVNSIVILTNMSIWEDLSGSIGDSIIYFGNPNSKPNVKFFSHEGDLIQITNFDSINESIAGFKVVNIDTIFVFSKYANNLYVVNDAGSIVNTIDLNNVENKDNDFQNEYYNSLNHYIVLSNNNIVLPTECRLSDTSNSLSQYDFVKKFYINNWRNGAIYLLSDIFTDSICFKNPFKINRYLFPYDSIYLNGYNSVYSFHDTVYYFSQLSNKIIRFNLELKMIDEFEIVTDYTKAYSKKISFDETNYLYLQDMVNDSYNEGYIVKIFNDQYRDCFYVTVRKDVTEEFYTENHYNPFVLIVYDRGFNKIKEIEFPDNKYSPLFLFCTEQGVNILRTDNTQNPNEKKAIFDTYIF